ncbi:MAG: hypothetical protein IPH57_07625 [Saprospiraceae bacterium]|nr:hypothetical protein [Saprospiraceae bacterium]
MNLKKITIVGLIGGVFAFFFGWLFFGIIFKDVMAFQMEGVWRGETEMVWWAMILSNLLWGWFFAFIFIHWANITTWFSGLKGGAILGFLMMAAFDSSMFSMTNLLTFNSMVIDILLNTVYTALIGAFIGWVAGKNWF